MNPYEELGVPHDASPEDIKAAHRRGVKRTHPDQPGGSAEKFGALQRSYEVLSDPDRRAHYDRTGQTEDDASKKMDSAVLTAMAQIVTQIIGAENLDLAQTDLKKMIKDGLHATLKAIAHDLNTYEGRLKRLDQMEKRFTRKKRKADEDGADVESVFMRHTFDAHRKSIRADIKRTETARDLHERVIGVFEAFDYDWAPPPPAPAHEAAWRELNERMMGGAVFRRPGSIFTDWA